MIWTKNITDISTLDGLQSWKLGQEPDSQLEVQLMLPDPLVAVGIGMRASPGNITTLKGYFGHLIARTRSSADPAAGSALRPDQEGSRVGSG